MERFIKLLTDNSSWIIDRTLYYARIHGYDDFIASSDRSRKMTVFGLSQSIIAAIRKYGDIPGLYANEDYSKDPIVSFTITETSIHRTRGVEMDSFLCLLKLYKQSYTDLVHAHYDGEEKDYFSLLIQRVYDRFEIGITTEWTRLCLAEIEEVNKKLEQQQENFQQLFENSPDAIAMLDIKDRIIDINSAFEKLFGYSQEEIQDLCINDVIIPSQYIEDGLHLSDAVIDGSIVQTEAIRERKNGTQVYVSITGYPIYRNNVITGINVFYSDITKRKETEEKLLQLSFHDSLTGLYNRTFFEQQMKYFQENYQNKLAILVCDIDGLKITNDSFGHDMGDTLILAVSKVISRCLRTEDIFARIGGDEFAVFLPGEDSEGAKAVCNKIQEALVSYNAKTSGPSLNVSIGYASLDNVSTVNMTELFKIADNQMYHAKHLRNKRA